MLATPIIEVNKNVNLNVAKTTPNNAASSMSNDFANVYDSAKESLRKTDTSSSVKNTETQKSSSNVENKTTSNENNVNNENKNVEYKNEVETSSSKVEQDNSQNQPKNNEGSEQNAQSETEMEVVDNTEVQELEVPVLENVEDINLKEILLAEAKTSEAEQINLKVQERNTEIASVDEKVKLNKVSIEKADAALNEQAKEMPENNSALKLRDVASTTVIENSTEVDTENLETLKNTDKNLIQENVKNTDVKTVMPKTQIVEKQANTTVDTSDIVEVEPKVETDTEKNQKINVKVSEDVKLDTTDVKKNANVVENVTPKTSLTQEKADDLDVEVTNVQKTSSTIANSKYANNTNNSGSENYNEQAQNQAQVQNKVQNNVEPKHEKIKFAQNLQDQTAKLNIQYAEPVTNLNEQVATVSTNVETQNTENVQIQFDTTSKPVMNTTQVNQTQATQQFQLPKQISDADILSQVNKQMDGKLVEDKGITKINMVLRPENLGKLQLELINSKEGLVASFTAENSDVKLILEKHLNSLRDTLAEQGVNVNNINVKVAATEKQDNMFQFDEQNPNNGQANQQNPEEKSQKTKNDNELLMSDDLEWMKKWNKNNLFQT
ncbi:MAG: flagellar hook-length control protein FliK [bacterium]|nr:flagellar hook-length control protein FliK [bacterium]